MKHIFLALLMATATTTFAYSQEANNQSPLVENQAETTTKNTINNELGETHTEEIIVTSSKIPVSLSKAGSGVTVITQEDIEKIQPNTFVDIMRRVPGITITETGAGKSPSIYIRGGNSGMTAILIDGVPIYDTTSIESTIDLSTIPIDSIAQIEVIKGPVSASMGGGTMNGAINIVTKQGYDKLFNATGNFGAGLGSLNFIGDAKFYGGNDIVNYMVSGSYHYDEGVSSAGKKYGNNEKDSDALSSVTAKFGVTPIDDLSSFIYFNYVNSKADTDNGAGPNMDNPDSISRTERYFVNWETKYLLKDLWEPTLKVNYVHQTRRYGDANSVYGSTSDYYTGSNLGVDFQNNFYVLKELAFTAGATFNYEEAEIPTSDPITWLPAGTYKAFEDNYGVYAQANVELFDSWTTILAFRGDKNGDRDFTPTYRISSVYDIKAIDLQIKAAFGTGYKSPSLYQVYDKQYGNRDLEAQKSISYEAGISNGILDKMIVWEVTWFENWFDNLIQWDTGISKYKNISSAHTRGIEVALTVTPLKWLDITASYMFVEAFDDKGEYMIRRPRHQGNASITITPIEKLKIYAEMIFRGKTIGSQYDTVPYTVAYELFNATVSYDVTDNINVWLKGTNLTDRQYEEIAGYGTKGLEVMLGLRLKI